MNVLSTDGLYSQMKNRNKESKYLLCIKEFHYKVWKYHLKMPNSAKIGILYITYGKNMIVRFALFKNLVQKYFLIQISTQVSHVNIV